MPWTEPRVWVVDDVPSVSRMNDIAKDVLYIAAHHDVSRAVTVTNGPNHVVSEESFEPFPVYIGTPADPSPNLYFDKREDDTTLFVAFSTQYFRTGLGGKHYYSANVNGTNYGGYVSQVEPSVILGYPPYMVTTGFEHQADEGLIKCVGVPSGWCYVQLEVKIAPGTGAYTTAANSGISLHVYEHWTGKENI